ncbi:hypothetical protein K1X12_12025 [Hyphomonas sp. WL0036]|uniref:hypothetical protein n=1 Tax=Hyphomonas sediminis TaxID=2866160 RepID=UPI001C814F3C|nr:hypothetical protein [Hyphomonas sediminis]MBY9067630.1 hypothetical protein [Hyphomonas sediminis]
MNKYPPGHFGIREWLGPPIGLLFELRHDPRFPMSMRASFRAISLQMVALVDDDELGLVGASPEDRVRFALSQIGGAP